MVDILRGRIEGPLVVEREVEVQGTIAGAARVRRDGSLRVRGTITGDLTVEPGATAIVYGAVLGRVYKTGGTVVIAHPEPSGREAPSNRANSSIDRV